ncbi:phasin family protein [Massilia arenosa]|uniref:Phasin family protein n=1 Tax=Zemynaea arenosa TaxID=2561931 RepID=A0A4Y9RZV2_9BURK|nr:TIGR01841 family phasin [Massilia arenosa]TFW13209.1 phasin family protein [Massilia arenosa]
MFAIPEQFSNATKASFDTQFAILSSLTNTTFQGVEKLVDLHLTAAKATLEESSAAARQLLSAKDPQEFFSLTAAQAQPNAEKALSYGRQVASIAAGTQAELTKTAEGAIAETNRKVVQLIDDVTKNAPAGTENFVAAVKASISNANAGYEQFARTTKQAIEAFESNVSTAVNQFAQATQKAAEAAPKAAPKK